MKTIVLLFIFSLTCALASGCLSDPLGATSRQQIAADGRVGVAVQERLAREAEARALVAAEDLRQDGATQRNANWVMVLPFVILAIGAVVVVALVVNWRGRIALEQTRLGYTAPQVGRTEFQLLRDAARRHNASLTFVGGKPVLLLPDGRRLLVERRAG